MEEAADVGERLAHGHARSRGMMATICRLQALRSMLYHSPTNYPKIATSALERCIASAHIFRCAFLPNEVQSQVEDSPAVAAVHSPSHFPTSFHHYNQNRCRPCRMLGPRVVLTRKTLHWLPELHCARVDAHLSLEALDLVARIATVTRLEI